MSRIGGWLNPSAGPSDYDLDKNRAEFIKEHGDVGEIVLIGWDFVDFCHSPMPDEYLGYAERFLKKAKERGINLASKTIDVTALIELAKASLHPSQLGEFISEEQVREVAETIQRGLVTLEI